MLSNKQEVSLQQCLNSLPYNLFKNSLFVYANQEQQQPQSEGQDLPTPQATQKLDENTQAKVDMLVNRMAEKKINEQMSKGFDEKAKQKVKDAVSQYIQGHIKQVFYANQQSNELDQLKTVIEKRVDLLIATYEPDKDVSELLAKKGKEKLATATQKRLEQLSLLLTGAKELQKALETQDLFKFLVMKYKMNGSDEKKQCQDIITYKDEIITRIKDHSESLDEAIKAIDEENQTHITALLETFRQNNVSFNDNTTPAEIRTQLIAFLKSATAGYTISELNPDLIPDVGGGDTNDKNGNKLQELPTQGVMYVTAGGKGLNVRAESNGTINTNATTATLAAGTKINILGGDPKQATINGATYNFYQIEYGDNKDKGWVAYMPKWIRKEKPQQKATAEENNTPAQPAIPQADVQSQQANEQPEASETNTEKFAKARTLITQLGFAQDNPTEFTPGERILKDVARDIEKGLSQEAQKYIDDFPQEIGEQLKSKLDNRTPQNLKLKQFSLDASTVTKIETAEDDKTIQEIVETAFNTYLAQVKDTAIKQQDKADRGLIYDEGWKLISSKPELLNQYKDRVGAKKIEIKKSDGGLIDFEVVFKGVFNDKKCTIAMQEDKTFTGNYAGQKIDSKTLNGYFDQIKIAMQKPEKKENPTDNEQLVAKMEKGIEKKQTPEQKAAHILKKSKLGDIAGGGKNFTYAQFAILPSAGDLKTYIDLQANKYDITPQPNQNVKELLTDIMKKKYSIA